jgi:hypothetical protein
MKAIKSTLGDLACFGLFILFWWSVLCWHPEGSVRAHDDKLTPATPAVVAFPDTLKRDCEYINTQITLLIERRDRLVAQEQIRQKVGPEYDVDYERLLWRLKAPAAKETKP